MKGALSEMKRSFLTIAAACIYLIAEYGWGGIRSKSESAGE